MIHPYYIYSLLALPLLIGISEVSWGYYSGSSILTHLTFHFAHASVWHLAGNALCFYVITRKGANWKELCVSLLLATLCSFIAPHKLPTIGLSGLIFALYGIRLMRLNNLSTRFLIQTLLVLIIPGLTGKVNVWLHISCLVSGYACAYLRHQLSQIMSDAKHYY